MIKIIIKRKDSIEGITIKGHANYDEYGKDIVCAAVSSISLTTCNAILSLEESIECNDKNGLLTIRVIKKTDITEKLLNNMIEMLKELESQYPKNIEIRNEE